MTTDAEARGVEREIDSAQANFMCDEMS